MRLGRIHGLAASSRQPPLLEAAVRLDEVVSVRGEHDADLPRLVSDRRGRVRRPRAPGGRCRFMHERGEDVGKYPRMPVTEWAAFAGGVPAEFPYDVRPPPCPRRAVSSL